MSLAQSSLESFSQSLQNKLSNWILPWLNLFLFKWLKILPADGYKVLEGLSVPFSCFEGSSSLWPQTAPPGMDSFRSHKNSLERLDLKGLLRQMQTWERVIFNCSQTLCLPSCFCDTSLHPNKVSRSTAGSRKINSPKQTAVNVTLRRRPLLSGCLHEAAWTRVKVAERHRLSEKCSLVLPMGELEQAVYCPVSSALNRRCCTVANSKSQSVKSRVTLSQAGSDGAPVTYTQAEDENINS